MPRVGWSDVCESTDTCALTGAAAFCAGIPDTDILANGPMWCYFYAMRHLEHTDLNIAGRFSGSQPDNNAVVYGTEPYLTKALQRLADEGRRPGLLFIENSCSLSLIGDDVAGIVKKMNLPFPCVTMDCGGLIGGFAEGYGRACISVLEKIADAAPEIKKGSVNLLGLSDFYYNGVEDRKELCRILTKAGYTVNCTAGSGSDVESLKRIGSAQLNIVCHEELGLSAAKYLKKRYSTDFVTAGVPYGIEGTRRWLEKINAALPAAKLDDVLAECEQERRALEQRNGDIRCVWGSLWFDRTVVAATGIAALCFAEALRSEWMDTGKLTVICHQKISAEYCSLADEIFTAEENRVGMSELLAEAADLLLVGSSSEASLLRRRGNENCSVLTLAFPAKEDVLLISYPFMGIRGSAHIQQLLWKLFIQKTLAEVKSVGV